MQFLQRISILFLANLILVTSTCFAADIHYCEDEVQSVAVFSKADPCKKMQKAPKVEKKKVSKCCMARKKREEQALNGKTIIKKKKCCHNEQVGFKADQNVDNTTVFIASPLVLDFGKNVLPIFSQNALPRVAKNALKAPPNIKIRGSFQAFYQVFRI